MLTDVAKAKTTVIMATVRSTGSAIEGAHRCTGQLCFPQPVTQERGHSLPTSTHNIVVLWPHRSAALGIEWPTCSQNQQQLGVGHGQGWELSLGMVTAGSWLWVMLCRGDSSSQALEGMSACYRPFSCMVTVQEGLPCSYLHTCLCKCHGIVLG